MRKRLLFQINRTKSSKVWALKLVFESQSNVFDLESCFYPNVLAQVRILQDFSLPIMIMKSRKLSGLDELGGNRWKDMLHIFARFLRIIDFRLET